MRHRRILIALMVTFLLFGCAAPASSAELPTPTPGPMPTATEEEGGPKATESITSPTATSTPEPSLKTEGPYLAYFRYVADTYQLVLLDANGDGRKAIALPNELMDSFMYYDRRPDTKLLSPDGRWLAFYTGSAGSYAEMPAPGTADLTLNLLDLETGQQQVLTPLLSKDYPNNFAQAAKKLGDPDTTAESLYGAFYVGITSSIGWSPDGRHLAFAGQMDGLSSDLYVYDVGTKEIRRLSSGDQELQWLNWSPDGKLILHSSVFGVGEGMRFDIYAAPVNGGPAPYISTSSLYEGITDWLAPHVYLENESQNGPGNYGLRAVDIDTGKVTKIWDGSFASYGIDLTGKWLVVKAFSPDSDPSLPPDPALNFKPGYFLIDLETMEKVYVPFPPDDPALDQGILPAGPDQKILSLREPDGSYVFFLSSTGEISSYPLGNSRVSPSPNQKYWVLLHDQDMQIFYMENVELKKIPLSTGYPLNTFDVTWRPDDSGFFLVGAREIYFVDIETGRTSLVETNRVDDFGDPKWVGGQ